MEIALYESVLKDNKIPQIEKNLLRYIVFRSRADSRICYFSQARAAQELVISLSRICRAVSWLRKHGYVKTTFNGKILCFEVCSTSTPAVLQEHSSYAAGAYRTRSELENKESPLPPVAGGKKPLSYVRWGGELIEVDAGAKKRLLTDKERGSLHGARAQRMLEFMRAKGFTARIVPKEEVDSWQETA